MTILLRFIDLAFTLYTFAIIARSLLSWFRLDYYHPVVQFLIQITEPLLAPLRRYIPPMGGLDLAPLAALLILWFAEQLLYTLIRAVVY